MAIKLTNNNVQQTAVQVNTNNNNNVVYRWVFMGDYACETIGTRKDLNEFLTDWNEETETSYDNWKEFNENEEWYCIVMERINE
jgi:hypothetical protein